MADTDHALPQVDILGRQPQRFLASQPCMYIDRDHGLEAGVLREGIQLRLDLSQREKPDLAVGLLASWDCINWVREPAVARAEAMLADGDVEHDVKDLTDAVGGLGTDAVQLHSLADVRPDSAGRELFNGRDAYMSDSQLVLDRDSLACPVSSRTLKGSEQMVRTTRTAAGTRTWADRPCWLPFFEASCASTGQVAGRPSAYGSSGADVMPLARAVEHHPRPDAGGTS